MFSNIPPYLDWSQTSAGQAQGNATFSFASGWQGANTLPNFLYLRLANDRGKNLWNTGWQRLCLANQAGKQTVYDPMTDITGAANANLQSPTLSACRAAPIPRHPRSTSRRRDR
jgi:hypothetical protein